MVAVTSDVDRLCRRSNSTRRASSAASWFIGPLTCDLQLVDARRGDHARIHRDGEHEAQSSPTRMPYERGRGPSSRCTVSTRNMTPPAA